MDPAKMKVVDLRAELGALGLDIKGNKPALVERLKKAFEAKTGNAVADTTILDTSTEEVEEPPTTRRSAASRTSRRVSSSLVQTTPAKKPRLAETIEEKVSEESDSVEAKSSEKAPVAVPPLQVVAVPGPQPVTVSEPQPSPKPEQQPSPKPEQQPSAKPEQQPSPKPEQQPSAKPEQQPSPKPEQQPSPKPKQQPSPKPEQQPSPKPELESSPKPEPAQHPPVDKSHQDDLYHPEDSQSPDIIKGHPSGEDRENAKMEVDQKTPKAADKNKTRWEANSTAEDNVMDHDGDKELKEEKPACELTEEEEWQVLNERLKIKEQQRIEKEKEQAEEDAKKLEEVSNDPVMLNRMIRKREKKQRWSNFYRAVEVTNEVLTPPTEAEVFGGKGKKKKNQEQELNVHIEPELDDSKVTLSWYDSDLNQYMGLPELNSVVPLSESAFAHAWAGARASHGVRGGRVCYEVRVGDVVATNELSEKNDESNGLRIGWSTQDQSLHLGEGETSWAFESSGRAVHNSEFKEYAKKLEEKDVVGVYLDLESSPCTISYTINGEEQGVAYEFQKESLGDRAVFPHILTRNICYKVNLGNDRYTMMTRTKIVRNRIEIPVEQVLEEKKRRMEELQKIKEEANKLEREKKEKDKLEREMRLKKAKEEKQKAEREKKEKERQERIERGEPEPEEPGKPQENGDKAEEPAVTHEPAQTDAEDKTQTDAGDKTQTDADAKTQTDSDSKIQTDAEATSDDKQAEAKPAEEKAQAVANDDPTQGEPQEVTEEQALTAGHVLDERIKFVTRYTVEEELAGEEAKLLDGYALMARANLVDGPRRPATLAECEVILMVGMPGAGKTHWARQHCAANLEKRYNIISTGMLFEHMKVDCKPLRPSYEGRWDAMVSKCAKCVLKLLEIARGRRRNYILDQTNVYPSAQRRKLREFEGYRRVAVVVVPSEENYNERRAKREANDVKEVPDPAIVDMKANFTLPEKGVFLDDVIYAELDKEEAEKVVEAFHKEAKSAGVVKEKVRKDRSTSRDVGHSGRKRQRSNERRRDDRRGSGSREGRDREDRWGGGSGGSRWDPAGRGRGSRWGGGGSRDRGPAPGGRYGNDRWGSGGRDGGRDTGRRDGFRGGRGGQGGPPSGPRPNQGPPARFDRDRNNGGGGGAGGWQRGGQQGHRGGNNRMPPGGANRPMLDNQNHQNQQGWNQWGAGGGQWRGWGAAGWNQNQGWGNWGNNWGNWNQQQQPAAAAVPNAGGAAANNKDAAAATAVQATQNQWGNYTPQQWYQWQQWQQQQQGWPGYQQQGNQQQQSTNPQADAEAWAKYYQNYGAAAANPALAQKADKK